MAELVNVRGLARRGIRIGGTGGGKVAKTITNKATSVVDLDDGATRRDVGHHSSIGQLIVISSVRTAVSSGVVTTNGTTTTITVSAGTLVRNVFGQTVTVAGATNQALATAPDATNPRGDLVVVDEATGAVTNVSGVAAASPVPPAPAVGKLVIATLAVAANASTPAGVVITDTAPRL